MTYVDSTTLLIYNIFALKTRQKPTKIAISIKKREVIMSDKMNFTVDYLKKRYVPLEDTNKIHYHPYYEILIINNGFLTYTTGSGIIKIAEKSIVFMPMNTMHNPFVQNQPYERYRIRLNKDFAKGLLVQEELLDYALKKPYIKQLNQKDFDEIYSITESLYKVFNKNNKTEVDKLSECMHLAMLILKGADAPAIPSTPHVSYISDVLEYIKAHYNAPLTIESIAEHFFVSKSKLIYDFKNYCRISVLEYIRMTKIEAAKEYLLKGWSIAATSNACGFSTPSYFIKVFSRITGLTPLKFQMKYVNY